MLNFSSLPGRLFSLALCAFAIHLPARFAEAKSFSNSYVAFELPARWDCQLIDTEWVCRNTDAAGDKSKEAIIILTAKEIGPTDSLEAYEAHLKTPRSLPSSQGTPILSNLIGGQVTRPKINDHVWVEAMHLNSEVRDYYTRYLATVKDRIAILVTLSAHKAHYSKYVTDFFRTVKSLRVLNTRALMNAQSRDSFAPSDGQLGPGMVAGAMSEDLGEEPPEGDGSSGGSPMMWVLLAAILLGGAGVFMLLGKDKRSRRK